MLEIHPILTVLSLIAQVFFMSVALLVIVCRITTIRLPIWYWGIFILVNSLLYIPLSHFYHVSDFLQLGSLLFTVFIFGKSLANNWMKFFTALYSKVFFDIISRLVYFGVYEKIVLAFFSDAFTRSLWIPILNLGVGIIQSVIVIVTNDFIIRIMGMDFKFLQENLAQKKVQGMIKPTILLLVFYFFIQYFSYLFVSLKIINFEMSLTLRGYVSKLFTILILFFIATFNQKMTLYYEEQLIQQKDEELQSITDYSHQIEELYQEIRSFRHDYSNILTSLRYSANQGNINSIRKILDEVISDSENKLRTNNFELANLSLVNNDALKGILSAKLSKAMSLGIFVKLEILYTIDIPASISTLDFIRIVSILLDNAIEATVESEEKLLFISYFEENANSILIIDNTTKDINFSIAELYQEGVSTKGDNRGIGLAIVKRLLANYPQVVIKTTAANRHFRQHFRF